MKKVLVFGIFDGVHPGHVHFLRQAKKCGDFLIVVAGRASACRQIKCKTPKYSLRKRIEQLDAVPCVTKAIPGDIKQGSYKVILREKPDIICLGYDQKELAQDFRRWMLECKTRIKIKILKPYQPNRYHTTLINQGVKAKLGE